MFRQPSKIIPTGLICLCLWMCSGCVSSYVQPNPAMPEYLKEPCAYPDEVKVETNSDMLILLAGFKNALGACAAKHRLAIEFIEQQLN